MVNSGSVELNYVCCKIRGSCTRRDGRFLLSKKPHGMKGFPIINSSFGACVAANRRDWFRLASW